MFLILLKVFRQIKDFFGFRTFNDFLPILIGYAKFWSFMYGLDYCFARTFVVQTCGKFHDSNESLLMTSFLAASIFIYYGKFQCIRHESTGIHHFHFHFHTKYANLYNS